MWVSFYVPWSLLLTFTSVFKRVPISKVDAALCAPGDARPIDVLSVLMRVLLVLPLCS